MYIGRNLCLCPFPFIVIFAGIHAVVSGKYNDEWIAALKNKFGFSIVPLRRSWFQADIHSPGLKGNRVRIPNSPAAVKLRFTPWRNTFATDAWMRWEGFKARSQSEDLPCK